LYRHPELVSGSTTVKNLITWSPSHLTTSQKFAFTLTEVLVSLAIIGVVAAMTIPTLMVNVNSRQWSTAATVFERKLDEAMKNMNTLQTVSGHKTTLSFVEELSKHFKTSKICNNDDIQSCFSSTVMWGAGTATPEEVDMSKITQAKHFGLDWGTELIGVQFANGVSGVVAYNPKCSGDPLSNQFKGSSCISMLYDVSANKDPNTSGKDLKNYGVINKLAGSSCAFEIDGTCFGTPFVPNSYHTWNACKDDYTSDDPEDQAYMQKYGLNYCYPGNDYFAKAAETCGGTSKMAQMSDLATIANYIFGTTEIGEYTENSGLTIAVDPSTLGFYEVLRALSIWSGEESTSYNYKINHRSFSMGRASSSFDSTGTGTTFRYSIADYNYAVCLGD